MTNRLEAERKMDEQLRTERPIEKEIDLLVNFYGKSLTRDEKDAMKTAIKTLINKGKL